MFSRQLTLNGKACSADLMSGDRVLAPALSDVKQMPE